MFFYLFVFIFALLFIKQNTQEAFENLFKLIRQLKSETRVIKLRSLCLFFSMAIEHGHPNITLEIIQQLNFKGYPIAVQSLRLLAFSEINRYRDVFEILRFYLKKDKAQTSLKVIHQDVLEKINENLKKTNDEEKIREFELLVKNLEDNNLIIKDITLKEALLKPIKPQTPRVNSPRNKKKSAQNDAENDSDAEVLANSSAAN